jgi:hypothetical protein
VRAAAAYLWDASVPVEMDEIDSMDKLDAALATSADNNLPVVIDWYHLRLCPTYRWQCCLATYLATCVLCDTGEESRRCCAMHYCSSAIYLTPRMLRL